jgi:hypothetical protein
LSVHSPPLSMRAMIGISPNKSLEGLKIGIYQDWYDCFELELFCYKIVVILKITLWIVVFIDF